MGLIGSVLGTIFCGGSGYYMSPLSFIKRPPLWVELISRYRGTHMQVRADGSWSQAHRAVQSASYALVARVAVWAHRSNLC